jgi:hypothetical protein
MRIGGGYLFAGSLVVALTLFQGWFGGEMVYTAGAGVAAAGQGTEPTTGRETPGKVKELLTPRKTHVSAPASGVGKTGGRGEKDAP